MRLILLATFLFPNFLITTYSQTYSKKDLLVDLNYMDSAFRYGHPSKLAFKENFDFRPKIQELTTTLTETISKIEYENAVRAVLMEVKCLHTSYNSWKIKDVKVVAKEKSFPNFVFTDGEKIWVNTKVNDSIPSSLKFSEEVISINGYKMDSLLPIMLNLHPDDGSGRQLNKYIINNFFPDFLTKYVQTDSLFTVVTLDNSGQQKTKIVTGIAFAPKVEVDADIFIQGNQAYYSQLNNSLGYLRIKMFQGGEKKFYEKVFQSVNQSKVQTLILDLRNNPGGNLYSCKDLLSFLLPDTSKFTFTYPSQNMSQFLPRKNRRKLKTQNFILRFIKSDKFEKTSEAKVFTHQIIPNYELGFKGKLYVLTNELTTSGASFVSAYSRHHRESTLIGQVTGGGEYWLNAAPGQYPLITLPASGIKIQTATHHIRFDTPAVHFNGITPDILLEYDATTFGKRDLEMEKVFELIGE